MNDVGLHIRIDRNFSEVSSKIRELSLSMFQCFFIAQATGRYLRPKAREIQEFAVLRPSIKRAYVHSSYYNNLAACKTVPRMLLYELALAKKLQFTHLILHPGAYAKGSNSSQGIDLIARNLNTLLQREHDITVVLENSGHAHPSLGGDIAELITIRQQLDHPEKVKICIDTAHAYVFGYDLVDPVARAAFWKFIETSVGFDAIELLHINDTLEAKGSSIDRHCIPGDGHLTREILKECLTLAGLQDKYGLFELPVVSSETEKEVLAWARTRS